MVAVRAMMYVSNDARRVQVSVTDRPFTASHCGQQGLLKDRNKASSDDLQLTTSSEIGKGADVSAQRNCCSSTALRVIVGLQGQPLIERCSRYDVLNRTTWHRQPGLCRTSWPEKTGLAGPLPGKMQLLSVVFVAVLLEPYSDSGAIPDVTLVTSNST